MTAPSLYRARTALGSLSAVGAAVAGFGAGVLFAGPLRAMAWPAVIIGIGVHLFGMVGTMRLQSASGYIPSAIERIGYWFCWAIIAALLVYAVMELVR
jgi:hypothetical protein